MAEVEIAIKVGEDELRLRGSEEWLRGYDTSIAAMLSKLNSSASTARTHNTPPLDEGVAKDGAPNDEVTFGEALQALPSGVSATDQILRAGLFAQSQSADNTFATRDANSLLLEQGVKVGNPSQCMANNLKAKRVFKVASGYRVSRSGIDYLAELESRN